MVDQMLPETDKPPTVSTTDPAFDVKAVAPRFSINWDQLKSWASGNGKILVGLVAVAIIGALISFVSTLPAQIPVNSIWAPLLLGGIGVIQSLLGLAMKYFGGPSKESLIQHSPVFARQSAMEDAKK